MLTTPQYWIDEYADRAYELYGEGLGAPVRPSKPLKSKTKALGRGTSNKPDRAALRAVKRESHE
jgi:hypothetical protein